jgi:TonB family protein
MIRASATALPFAVVLCAVAASGCSFHARDASSYRKDTRALLSTKDPDIKSCYDAELKKDSKIAGTVVVKFKVEKETGKITDVKVDNDSNAPESLSKCVVQAIDGLALQPPDARDGDATFRWEFQVKS